MRDFSRLLRPRSIAVIGGGAWCEAIIEAAQRVGFKGDIFPVHPTGKEIAGLKSIKRLEDWGGPIDAAFIGINRFATIEAVTALNRLGAGGAVCFASGFSEAAAEDDAATDLQARLVAAAGEMPILGPNCYGFVNALDGAALWPDQHGCTPVQSGVAILTQSSNIAINLSNQQRALPIAYLVTCGNMAQTGQADIARALLDDDRVTAIGLHIEGFSDLRVWESFAREAYAKGIPVVALKVGASEQAQAATVSHTASLAGSDAGARALLERFGFARVGDLAGFLETLKLLHLTGPLPNNRIASISCSGGEASLIADMSLDHGLTFPPLSQDQRSGLAEALGPMVALANPLDYHTYIWRDADAMTQAWGAMVAPDNAMTLSIVDYPPEGNGAWACATEAAVGARATTGKPFAMVASLPELMPVDVARTLMHGNVVPLNGLREALIAIQAATQIGAPNEAPLMLSQGPLTSTVLDEDQAKSDLEAVGIDLPRRAVSGIDGLAQVAADIGGPLVLKGLGIAHKTEAGAVALNQTAETITQTARTIPGSKFLVEEMITDGVGELLIGVTRDPAHGFVMTIAAGGVLTELLTDSVSFLVPTSRGHVKQALTRLKTYPLLTGFRGKPPANIDAILTLVEALQSYVLANADVLDEAEINPVICTPTRAVAVDALIRKALK